MNAYLKWFRRLTWVGFLVNLGFVLPALFVPDLMETIFGPGSVELSYLWVAAAGMLLFVASCFYLPAARDPLRYPVYAWLSVAGRVIASTFWLWQNARWHLPGPVSSFWMTDGAFGLVFLVLLQLGMPAAHKISAANLARMVSSWRFRPAANAHHASFRALVLLGVALNLAFAAAALVAPAWLAAWLHTTNVTFTFLWLGNCGMLLLQIALFALPLANDPVKYPVHAWLNVASRFFGAGFWLWQDAHWRLDSPLRWFWLPPLVLGVLQAMALQGALPEQYRAGRVNTLAWLRRLPRDLAGALPSALGRVAVALLAILLAVVGYGLWVNLAKAEPDTVFADGADQFKYGAIGLGQAYRVPLYVWNVMPDVCPDLMPAHDSTGAGRPSSGLPRWASLGLLYEPGKDLPVGFARRQIGYASVEPNCALCHTSSYRTAADAPQQVILGGPAHELDLQAFQWFLYDCAASPAFTVDNLMTKIEAKHQLGWFEKQVYRLAILPFAKSGLAVQRAAYQWQKSRPRQGRGRTDTFNPTKIVVYHQPDDGSIGTVDLPAIWNQRARVGLYLHWDGNNNAITERNYAAAMAVGASPYSVIEANFQRVTQFVLGLPPPRFPFAVDTAAASRGWIVYQEQCAGCHAFGSEKVGTVTSIAEIGTDRHRLDSFTPALVATFHTIDEGPFVFNAYRKTDGYSNLPIDGTWARAPYLHNGSVATLADLLSPVDQRTRKFLRGSNLYDAERMGWTVDPPANGPGFEQDAAVQGNGNAGHTYGVDLTAEQKRDLLEYLKTL